MKSEPSYNFHYGHLLPKKPGVLQVDELRVITCQDCGASVETRSRNRKRCDSCAAERQERNNQRTYAKRKARAAARNTIAR